MTIDASFPEVFEAAMREALGGVHTALPGKVKTFYPATPTTPEYIDVEMMCEASFFDRDGVRDFEKRPVLPNVPINWPRCGDWVMTFPIAAGDFVLLIFCEQSLAEFRTTGQVSRPKDARRHSIGWPYAIPGAFPDVKPLSSNPIDLAARAAGIVIGKHNGTQRIEISDAGIKLGKNAVDPVANATSVDAFISGLKSALNGAVPVAGDGGAAVKTALMTYLNSVTTVGFPNTKGS